MRHADGTSRLRNADDRIRVIRRRGHKAGRIGEATGNFETMRASSPASSGPAGPLFEGQVGAHYLLTMLIGAEPRGLPGTRIEQVEFQRGQEGHPLDDIVIHARDACGSAAVLEIQAKRSLRLTRSDKRFREVVARMVQASRQPGFFERRHELAVAVGRAPLNVQGPFQDVLTWARQLDSVDTFTGRVERPHSGNDAMRRFVEAFEANMASAGAESHAEAVLRLLSRFQILDFDFTAQGSAHEAWQLERAAQALDPDDVARANALWRVLVELAIEVASSGGRFDRNSLVQGLQAGGFRLAGERRYSSVRSALAEDARHALEDIKDRVGNVRLPRAKHLATVRSVLEQGRYVEIRGEPGVGKSGLLKRLAEERSAQSRIVTLSPGRVSAGGWGAMRTALGFQDKARALLVDLASSGGGMLFVDGLESYSEEERLAVVDLLREVAEVPGFSVVATTRPGLDGADDGPEWPPADVIGRLGRVVVPIGELGEDEVSELRDAAPELAPLLADAHPARDVVRNLFRLDRLARRQDGQVPVHTEVDMALDWWRTADGKKKGRRGRIRLLRTLAEQTVSGNTLDARTMPAAAVDDLVKSRAIRDLGGDKVMFGHDILRDWAVAGLINGDSGILRGLPLDRPSPASIVRGFELAARMSLERAEDETGWRTLLDSASQEGMHGSWRRAALLAVVRSEAGKELLQRAAPSLLADDARLLIEMMRAVKAVEVRPLSELASAADVAVPEAAAGVYVPSSFAWTRLMLWMLELGDDLPDAATEDAADFFQAAYVGVLDLRECGGLLAHWHYRRLEKLGGRWSGSTASSLRWGFLSVCHFAPPLAVAYLRSLMECNAIDAAIRDVWNLSSFVAQAAPEELAELTLAMLIPRKRIRNSRLRQGVPSSMSDLPSSDWDDRGRRPFDLNDFGFAPPSPKHGPFLALLEHAPETGLKLVRKLVDHAISVRLRGRAEHAESITVPFGEGQRNFSWTNTYAWSRIWGNGDPCVQSALMALEAWAHLRIENGEDIGAVLADLVPQDGGPAAYLLVAVDVVLSHRPDSAKAAIPLVACPELLCLDLHRSTFDQSRDPDIPGLDAFFRARPSRDRPLMDLLGWYAVCGSSEARAEIERQLQRAVERLGPFGEQADKFHPEFMAVHALNVLDPINWRMTSDNGPQRESNEIWKYEPPREEREHMERLKTVALPHMADREMQISILAAVEDQSRSSSDFASQAVAWALQSDPQTGDEAEDIKSRNLGIIAAAVVAMRDGDEDLRVRHREWARGVFQEALVKETDTRLVPAMILSSNPVAMAFVGIACLLLEGVKPADVRTLLHAASRRDLLAVVGFQNAAGMIQAVDKRLPRALLRTAFASCIHPLQERSGGDRDSGTERRVSRVLDSECRWLADEGVEPQWPEFPPAHPVHALGLRIGSIDMELPRETKSAVTREQTGEVFHDSSAALWLRSSSGLFDVETNPWLLDVARSYAEWTAVANGRDFRRQDRLQGRPLEWNMAFCSLVAHCLPGMTVEEIEQIALDPIRSLPDEPFFEAASHTLRGVDQMHFGSGSLAEAEAVHVRTSLAERLLKSPDWRLESSKASGSMEVHMGSAVAAFFFNNWFRWPPSSCYLRAPGIDRMDLFLPLLKRLAVEGPGGFVAVLVLDLVEVSPRIGLLPLVTAAAEAWLEAHPDNTAFWEHCGIARRLCGVFERIGQHKPYAAWDLPLRDRVGDIVSALVGLGVSQAVRLEQDLASSGIEPR